MALAIQGARLDGGQLCSPNMTSWPHRARGRAPGYPRGAGLVALSLALLAGCGGTERRGARGEP